MKNKYDVLENEYKKTAEELAAITGWTPDQAEKVLALFSGVSQKQVVTAAKKERKTQRDAKFMATKKLLENYRNLKTSIKCGMEHSLKLLEDHEYQCLMEKEESIRNQNLASMARLTASNQVLWTRLNAALDCFKEMCKNNERVAIQREYPLIQARYLSDCQMDTCDLLERFAIESAQYYRSLNAAITDLSVILFGCDCAEDFCLSRDM